MPEPSVVALAVALVLLPSLLGAGLAALLRRRFGERPWAPLVASILPWTGLLGGGLAATVALGWWTAADALASLRRTADLRFFDLGDRPVTLTTLLTVAAMVWISFRISTWVQARILATVEENSEGSAIAVGARLAHYAILFLGFGVGLSTAGIDLSALFAAGAVFAIGLGFAMQTIAQNFVSGVILLMEGAIRPGDVLEVDGEVVKVEKMGIRSTVVRDLDDVESIVPNADLVAARVKNQTMTSRLVRVRAPVGVHYDSDLDAVFAVLRAVGAAFPEAQESRPPVVLLTAFGSSSVDFEVSVWTGRPWAAAQIRSQLMHDVWNALRDANITIAYPQLDVHLDDELQKAMIARQRHADVV